ncbi:hypothetical protein NTE_02821 [Candidatus Nitrososphaera evergladensis SR1]|jgi:hypothetical protein|uniref:Uncharacterized protein n=1 Tax=Candidatus Nitrososphaera evergladensis SR1 TaxID=1459636 RepID=A0A075MTE2_9ARCH|nr:hypothetical protein [Candidatus Nitrososphaera evergladensis]AIF84861.1 hypothetical protein NTE_02821 [Candidatus Nitrososphaera evergladensis SR1]
MTRMSQGDSGTKIKASMMTKHRFLATAMTGILLTAAFSAAWVTTTIGTANAQVVVGESTIARDSVLLTGPLTIPAGGFMHVYDATPYHIMKGHIALQVPCDAQHNASVQVLIGQAPDLKPANLEFVSQLSTPGEQCMYHVDIASHDDPNNPIITDVAIKNAGSEDVQLTDTSTVFVGVDEIMPNLAAAEQGGAEGGGGGGMNMTEGGGM